MEWIVRKENLLEGYEVVGKVEGRTEKQKVLYQELLNSLFLGTTSRESKHYLFLLFLCRSAKESESWGRKLDGLCVHPMDVLIYERRIRQKELSVVF